MRHYLHNDNASEIASATRLSLSVLPLLFPDLVDISSTLGASQVRCVRKVCGGQGCTAIPRPYRTHSLTPSQLTPSQLTPTPSPFPGDIFLALPTSADFDIAKLLPKIVTNGGVKHLSELVDRVGVNFEKHEILVGLGAALGVAEEKDRASIMSLIGTVSSDGFDFCAETSAK